MWKYIGVLVVLLAAIGASVAQAPAIPKQECTDCYANIITQTDSQTVQNVKIGMSDVGNDLVGIGNEGLSAAIIVTPKVNSTADGNFRAAPFARIDQAMTQTIDTLGTLNPTLGEEGAKGLTWNKAIQAAWIANQGVKERENLSWVKEGSYIAQTTNQMTKNIYDYDSREASKILNVDNKLAMIVDDLKTVIDLTAKANSTTSDSQASAGTVTNKVNITVKAADPA